MKFLKERNNTLALELDFLTLYTHTKYNYTTIEELNKEDVLIDYDMYNVVEVDKLSIAAVHFDLNILSSYVDIHSKCKIYRHKETGCIHYLETDKFYDVSFMTPLESLSTYEFDLKSIEFTDMVECTDHDHSKVYEEINYLLTFTNEIVF